MQKKDSKLTIAVIVPIVIAIITALGVIIAAKIGHNEQGKEENNLSQRGVEEQNYFVNSTISIIKHNNIDTQKIVITK